MASVCYRGSYRATSLVPRFSRSKYTAPPSAKHLANVKLQVATQPNPRARKDRVEQSKVVTVQLLSLSSTPVSCR